MKLPNKFEFTTKWDKDVYIMCKRDDGMCHCYDYNEETTEPSLSNWLPEFVSRNIEEGVWLITKNLDEPEMVFPFTYKHKHFPQSGTVYKGLAGGITVVFDDSSQDCMGWELDDAKRFVKEGTWIVTSVGEQKPACVHDYFFGDVSHAEGEHNEAAKTTYSSLAIKVDSSQVDEATHKFNMLAQAVENVNISLESMQALLREIGQGGATGVTEYTGDYFPKIDLELLK